MKKKTFKNKEDIQELGVLLRLAVQLLNKAHIKSGCNMGKTDPLVLKLQRVIDKIEIVRSEFDDNLEKLMDDKTLTLFNGDLELNKVFYGDVKEQCEYVIEKYIK